jgi:CO/xanthine dehydrogenase Mo-binding subunit
MDLVAQRLGLDPVEFRRRNLVHAGEIMVDGEPIQGDTAHLVLERAAACLDWSAPLPPGRGRGLAFSERGTGAGRAAVQVSVDGTGTVVARTGVPEQGGGAHTVIQQVVARTLGVPARLVRVEQGDTDAGPFDQGVGGSRVTNSTGGAAQRATEQLRDRLCMLAAEARGWREGSVRLEAGAFVSDDQREDFSRLAGALARSEGGLIREEVDHRAARGPSGFACHAVEVDVDRETGRVRLEKLVAVHDVGCAINPVGLMGQIHGGLLQSLGQTLMEELAIVDGQPRAINFGEYKIPCAADIPDLRVELIEEHDGPGPFGAKGVGEISALPAAAAIANAISNAVGVRLMELPITAEKVLAGLRAQA